MDGKGGMGSDPENTKGGKEIQVAVVGGKSIGAIELRPKRKFYDYAAKYRKSAKTLHVMPADIPKKNITKF